MRLIYGTAAVLAFAASGCSIAYADAPPAKDGLYFPTATAQTEADEYTRYELLAPDTSSLDRKSVV